MIRLLILFLTLGLSAFAAKAQTTAAGVPLDAPWKERVFGFCREAMDHPAWGVSHAERVYLLAMDVTTRSARTANTDVIFAVAFLHDLGACAPYAVAGTPHQAISAERCGEILLKAGFAMEKLPRVKAAILGHHQLTPSDDTPWEAVAVHDADYLDFMGAMGMGRTLQKRSADLRGARERIENCLKEADTQLLSTGAKQLAPARASVMRSFLDALDAESFGGKAL